jgi:integrase/recombinase XerD
LQQVLEDIQRPIIEKYIKSMERENLDSYYIKNTLKLLKRVNLLTATNESMIEFLGKIRKPESADPLHRWIGAYNTYVVYLKRFFKWNGNPEAMAGIRQLKRKEKSAYKPSDLWTQEEDLIFFKYCPSKKYSCYHAVARDSSCRPSELLRVKVKDVVFKMSGNKQYAEILVNGKTGPRHIPLINSIPYLKDWIDNHPEKNNPNAYLFAENRKMISSTGVRNYYKKTLRPYFASLKDIPLEDKNVIKELLQKPWNPYIQRHTSLTGKSKILKEHVLRQHAGWSINSKMPQVYLHYFGNESNEAILEAYGLKPKEQQTNKLQPVTCSNCGEQNKIDSKFCFKCRMVLSYDAWEEVTDEQVKKVVDLDLVAQLNERLKALESKIG